MSNRQTGQRSHRRQRSVAGVESAPPIGGAAACRRLHRLAVDDTDAGSGLATGLSPNLTTEPIMDLLPRAIQPEATVVIMHPAPRRELMRQLSPRATRAVQIQNCIDYLTHVDCAWASARPGRRYRRHDQSPLIIRHVRWVWHPFHTLLSAKKRLFTHVLATARYRSAREAPSPRSYFSFLISSSLIQRRGQSVTTFPAARARTFMTRAVRLSAGVSSGAVAHRPASPDVCDPYDGDRSTRCRNASTAHDVHPNRMYDRRSDVSGPTACVVGCGATLLSSNVGSGSVTFTGKADAKWLPRGIPWLSAITMHSVPLSRFVSPAHASPFLLSPQLKLWGGIEAVRHPEVRFPPDSAVFDDPRSAVVLGVRLLHRCPPAGDRPTPRFNRILLVRSGGSSLDTGAMCQEIYPLILRRSLFLVRKQFASTKASSQSSQRSSSRSASNVHRLTQMPRVSQSRSRRQYVLDDGYLLGKSCQRAPLRRIHRMLSNTERLSIGL